MTVYVYINTGKQVGDAEHVKVFANQMLRKHGLQRTIPKAWPLNMTFWSKRDRQLRRP